MQLELILLEVVRSVFEFHCFLDSFEVKRPQLSFSVCSDISLGGNNNSQLPAQVLLSRNVVKYTGTSQRTSEASSRSCSHWLYEGNKLHIVVKQRHLEPLFVLQVFVKPKSGKLYEDKLMCIT